VFEQGVFEAVGLLSYWYIPTSLSLDGPYFSLDARPCKSMPDHLTDLIRHIRMLQDW